MSAAVTAEFGNNGRLADVVTASNLASTLGVANASGSTVAQKLSDAMATQASTAVTNAGVVTSSNLENELAQILFGESVGSGETFESKFKALVKDAVVEEAPETGTVGGGHGS